MSNFFVNVLLPLPFDKPFTYKVNDEIAADIAVGDLLKVPFRKKELWGLVVEIDVKLDAIDPKKIKEVLAKNQQVKFDDKLIEFINRISSYNLAPNGLVLKAFIGILNSDKIKKPNFKAKVQEIDVQKFALKTLSEKQQKIADEILQEVQKNQHAVNLLDGVTGSGKTEVYFAVIAGILRGYCNFDSFSLHSVTSCHCESTSCHSERSEESLNVEARDLRSFADAQDDKEGAQDDKEGAQDDKEVRYHKEVQYHKEVRYHKEGGWDEREVANQILILLPEIALTSQLLKRFEEQFGFKPALWHSKISRKEKREIFYGVISGSIKVLIGARSALLLPFKNLKLIVLDEEHDSSFKQEEIFNFHARDMAILKAKIENFSVILSSATPAIESYVNAQNEKYRHCILDNNFNEQKSEIKIIDLCREKLPKNNFIASELRKRVIENFEKNQQTLLFLNRRGYAPVTLCKNCGQKVNCPNCSSYMVAHKKSNKMSCHYCGESHKFSGNCKFCGSEDSLIDIGVGVEKIKEEVESFLPQARIALVTSDSVTNFDEAEELVSKISNHEIDIIIGTQLIAKGYDFAGLTLVGVVDADSGFYASDLKSMERSYQLLKQVIGRAGRRKEQGSVFIQTYNPQNLIFEKIIKQDKAGFYNFEISNRRNLNMPPFSKMASFVISAFEEKNALSFAKKLISVFPFDENIELLGPAQMPILKLKNRYNYRVFVKTSKKINLQKLILDVMKNLEIPTNIRVKIDIDPQ
ncbi:MAG: primosomal protein N' [Pelagibacterales bacterium]|nr:primosomal protein N' [Pelagibacterales bacterium]